MIAVGSLVLGSGLLGILGRAADLVPQQWDSPLCVKVGQCTRQSSFPARNMAPTPPDYGESGSLLEVATAAQGSVTCPDGKLKDPQYSVLFFSTVTGTPESPTFAASPRDGVAPVVHVVRRVDENRDRTLCPTETKSSLLSGPRAPLLPPAARILGHTARPHRLVPTLGSYA